VTVRPDECVLGFGIALSEEGFYRQSQNPNGGDFNSNSVIGVYDAAGNVIETHEHEGDFKEA